MRKKGTKLIALLVCALVGVMMFSIASFAAEECDYTMRVDPSAGTVQEGDVVTVVMESNDMEVASFAGGFAFDTERFEVIEIQDDATAPGAEEPYFEALSTVEEANANGSVGFAKVRTAVGKVVARQLLTVKLKAKETGVATFAIFEDSDQGEGVPAKKIDAGGEGSPITNIDVVEPLKLTKVPAKDATCTEAGYEAYWIDKETGKMYSDAEGRNPIAAPVEIPAKGHEWSIKDESVKWIGSDTNGYTAAIATLICSRCGEIRENVESVDVKVETDRNGNKYYTAFFQYDNFTLASQPKIVKAGGSAQPADKGKKGVPTGDDNVVWLYVGGMAVAALLIAGCIIVLRRRSAKNNK